MPKISLEEGKLVVVGASMAIIVSRRYPIFNFWHHAKILEGNAGIVP